MELTVLDVARAHNRSERLVQLAVRSGSLVAHRHVGRVTLLDDIAVRAWSRSLGSGRRWTPAVKEAAFDLISLGVTTRLTPSERSRLKSRLRDMTARDIAHAAGGIGSWARFRGDVPSEARLAGPSKIDAADLDMVPGASWLTFVETDDIDRFELRHHVSRDPDGNLGVLERRRPDDRIARILLDTYLLGDARQSQAAGVLIEARRP